MRLSVPEYAFPAKSVPDTVAVVDVNDVDTVQVYSHTEADEVADINALVTIPDRLIVGVGVIASENVAVKITASELTTTLSESLSIRLTVGGALSVIVKVRLSVPEYAFPAKSVPDMVTETWLEIVEETNQEYCHLEYLLFLQVHAPDGSE